MKSTLIYFAEEFSTVKAEQFIEQELIFLASKFEKIVVLPIRNNISECKYKLPENIEVLDFQIYKPYNRINTLFSNSGLLLSVLLCELRHSKNKRKYFTKSKKYFNYLLHAVNVSNRLKDEIVNKYGDRVTYYSFWFNIWVLYLSLVKRQKDLKLVTRAHGGDYDEDQTKLFFPFRSFQVKNINVISPVSEFGVNYIKNKYPFNTAVVQKSYLGVRAFGLNPDKEHVDFILVSCSSLIPLKRVHLIVEILKHTNFKIKWLHFGDGPLREELLEKAKQLPSNVSFEFKGHVTNEMILEFYKGQTVDLVINVSESEGIPVSLMEAISFGIPVIGTSICGVPEIVGEKTGFLIPKDFDPVQIAGLINEYREFPSEQKSKLRISAREYWLNNFNLEVNYNKFFETYLN